MRTIIAGKPSMARKIARIAGVIRREEGYLEGGGYVVTWAFGHLVQLAMSDGHDVRGLVHDDLPIIPDTFTFIPRQVRVEKGYKSDSGVVSRMKVIKGLFDMSEQIIVATDAEHEGEFIFRYLYHYTGCTTPFVHLWVSSPTDKTTREGLQKLENGNKYDNLYLAVKTRGESNWLVGINSIQALSIVAGHGTYSVGRMQTPALAMVCKRYRENRRFASEAFWQFHTATDGCDGEVAKFSFSEKWKGKEPVMELYNKVRAVGCTTVMKTERKEKTEDTPLLYNLTTLRKKANTRHGFTTEQTLETTQKLYEKKLMTYLGTGGHHIPEDMYAEILKLLTLIGMQSEWKDKVRAKVAPTRRSVNDGKVTDHCALFVTGEKPLFLPKEDGIPYHMIAGRMIEALSEKCVKDVTIITTEYAGMEFTVKGSAVKQVGWRAVYGEEKEDVILPDSHEGDYLTTKGVSVTEGRIKSEPLHTEATLLSAMEMTGKETEDDALCQAMKDCGIGTSTTRASIIGTLSKRGYVRRHKESLVPTEKGLALNSVVKTIRIADVAIMGEREQELAHTGRSEVSADAFHKEVEAYTWEITSELLSCDKLFGSRGSGCAYPKYGTDRTRFYGKVVRRDNTECGLPVFRLKAGRTLSDDEIKDLLTEGHTKLLKGFKSKQGRSFDVAVAPDGGYSTTFVFPEVKRGKKFSGRKEQY